jgi:hypothetical protein
MAESVAKQFARLGYEALAYVLPGVVELCAYYVLIRRHDEPHRWLHDAVRTVSHITLPEILLVLGAGYVIGRLLYVVADFSIKPLVKRTLGDPDKYLVTTNTARWGRFASDYPASFKTALAQRIDDVLGIDGMAAPRLKLVEAWISRRQGGPDAVQEHNHATEIMARNLAAAGLTVVVLAALLSMWLTCLAACAYVAAMTYYYYVRQVKRARGLYEYFFVCSA